MGANQLDKDDLVDMSAVLQALSPGIPNHPAAAAFPCPLLATPLQYSTLLQQPLQRINQPVCCSILLFCSSFSSSSSSICLLINTFSPLSFLLFFSCFSVR